MLAKATTRGQPKSFKAQNRNFSDDGVEFTCVIAEFVLVIENKNVLEIKAPFKPQVHLSFIIGNLIFHVC